MRHYFPIIFLLAGLSLFGQSPVAWRTFTVGNGSIQRKLCPETYQLYPRNNANKAKVVLEGKVSQGEDRIRIKVTRRSQDGSIRSVYDETLLPAAGNFGATVTIEAGLYEYAFYYQLGDGHMVLIADHVVCGDVYLASGQSNVDTWDLSNDEVRMLNIKYGPGYEGEPYSQYARYCRSFGTGLPVPQNLKWGIPGVAYFGFIHLGAWVKVLQHELVKKEQVPVLVISGAMGATNITHNHMPEPGEYFFDSLTYFKPPTGVPKSATPAYRLFSRLNSLVYAAGVENSIRGIFWMQGDAGQYDISNGYVQEFRKMHALWKRFFPGFRKTYLVQVHSWIEHENGMRNISEEQRQLADSIPDLVLMSANGIGYHRLGRSSAIHFRAQGYIKLGEQMLDLLLEKEYGRELGEVEPPSIVAAARKGHTLRLYFNQALSATHSDNIENILSMIKFDSGYNIKSNGKIVKNRLYLTIGDTNVAMVSYAGFLPGKLVEPDYFEPDFPCYLRNRNGIAALSFHKIPVLSYDTTAFYEKLVLPAEAPDTEVPLVYPNPFSDDLSLYFPEGTLVRNMQVYIDITDENGRIAYQGWHAAAPWVRLDTKGLSPGIYILRYKTYKGEGSQRLVKRGADH